MEEVVEDHPEFSIVFSGAGWRVFHKALDDCP